MMYEFFHTAVNTVAHHWFLSLLYVVLSARIIWRFRNQVVLQSHWSHRLRGCLVNRWQSPPRRVAGEVVWAIFVLSLTLFLFLPFTPFLALVLHLRDEKRMREWRAKSEEQSRLAIERKWRENEARARTRRQWFEQNPPGLYYNTVSGITAVVRPAEYAEARALMKRQRRNGFWEKDNVLLPMPQTFVFVTKQGFETIDRTGLGDGIRRYKVTGMLADLDDLVERHGVEMVRAEDIFVPWVNETLVPFTEQLGIFRDCHGATYEELIMRQAPAELQPLP